MEVPNVEEYSPPSCPKTVTVRRNPHRRARNTPMTNIPLIGGVEKPIRAHQNDISSFPIQEILSIEIKENLEVESESAEEQVSENLKVYLRIRPVVVQSTVGKKEKIGAANVWPKNPRVKGNADKKVKKNSSEVCLMIKDSHSVTVVPPAKMQSSKRVKSEVYEGFSHVFAPEASQNEVYEEMVSPLVNDFMRGKSGMLVALGPSGSGKTHTIFGSVKDPGMVTLALQKMFSEDAEKSKSSRTFHLSMFEIVSEKGKSEKILDLSQDGTDLCTQQTSIKGLQETRVYDLQQAESIIASGLLRRATAMTNSNSQSSRSQCIINIRCGHKKLDGEVGANSKSSILTIVDLAGAEREKKTGNQGARLLESNFINNTSMVFGQCLRSLLEHQKNPKKPLQKFFQNSMLTRYLRDYLEGKKRMSLLLTARTEGEDYLDTSFLLRQASPYTKIKFECIEEPVNLNYNKRLRQTMPMPEQFKRMKIGEVEACSSDGIDDDKLINVSIQSEDIFIKAKSKDRDSPRVDQTKIEREDRKYQVLLGFSKALWNVLIDYKKKLEVAENENHCLREELKDFKSHHSSQLVASDKVNSELSSCQLTSSEQSATKSCDSGKCQLQNEVVKDADNEACTSEEEFKDLKSHTPQILASPEVSSTEDHCSVDPVELRKSSQDPELGDVEVEDASLDCEASRISASSCQCSDEEDEKTEERKDSTHAEFTANSLLSLDNSTYQPQHEEGKVNSELSSCQLTSSEQSATKSCDSGKCQLQNEVVKDADNEACTLEEEFKDLKSQNPSQIVASPEVSSTEDHCSVDPEELRKSSEDPELGDVEVEDTSLECEAAMILSSLCQCSDDEDERTKERKDSTHKEFTSNSLLSPNSSRYPPQHEDGKKQLHAPSPKAKDVRTWNCRRDDRSASKVVPKNTSCDNSRNAEKPKRRLLPASSILLKDIGNVDFMDENEKAKVRPKGGTKGEKKAATITVKNRSEGNLALLRLLTNQTR